MWHFHLFPRPFIPSPLYKSIFNSLYLFTHPGIGSSIQLIKSRYLWPNMNKSIKQNVQYASSQKSTYIQNLPFKTLNYLPSFCLQMTHIDIFRLLPPVYNNSDPPLPKPLQRSPNMYWSCSTLDRIVATNWNNGNQ